MPRSTGGERGPGSARLIVGSRPVHADLEAALADWKHTERAVLFPTGFATNLGVLTTLGGRGVLVCSDALNHASIIDGCRLSRARVEVFRHRDLDHVDHLLTTVPAERAVVVTDTVFSMDGDVADVDALADLCARRGALLVLDEAHAVLGPDPDLARARSSSHRHALEDGRRAGRVRRRTRSPHRADREPGPLVYLHDRPLPG